ncbi:hypothetical protein VNO80_21258 [Phaseolus coccineus]|uniref:Uncharacterized protein n=1 Tax=Phaseolus coccineus TaxID=3886 RepID=A0AAN9M252_PHACN
MLIVVWVNNFEKKVVDLQWSKRQASVKILPLVEMPIRSLVEVESPSPLRYLIGAAVMMIGVVLPVGYMMFRNKRVPSSSSYSKQTNKVLI